MQVAPFLQGFSEQGVCKYNTRLIEFEEHAENAYNSKNKTPVFVQNLPDQNHEQKKTLFCFLICLCVCANRTYVDAVVVKVRVFVELVGGVVLVGGEELTQKMAEVVDGFCSHVERDTGRVAKASYIAEGDIRNKRRSDYGGVQMVKRVTDEVRVG